MLQRVGGAFGASVLLVVLPAVVAFGSPAVAKAPSPTPSASGSANPNLGPSVAGVAMCSISDPQVTEVSGLVVTANGYVVINDSNTERSREKIFFLDQQCRQTRSVGYPSSAFDPEDLAVSKDGTLWVADVGDNTTLTGGSGNRRSSIALWSLAPGSNSPVIHRLAYPDGRARDAEALLFDGEGRPVIITKDPVGEVFTLKEPLPANNANPAALTRAGSFRPQTTGTANPYGIVGTAVVTGAAMSPDGKRAVVRTMSDAYEFDVTDGDVVAAITTGTPRITPLPSEPQGESIAYSQDGTEFLTVSDQPKTTSILRYRRFVPAAPPSASPAPAQPQQAKERSFLQSLSLYDITRIVIGIGLLGVLMIVIGVVAVIRSRRRRRALLAAAPAAQHDADPAASAAQHDADPAASAAQHDADPAGSAAQRGAGSAGSAAQSGAGSAAGQARGLAVPPIQEAGSATLGSSETSADAPVGRESGSPYGSIATDSSSATMPVATPGAQPAPTQPRPAQAPALPGTAQADLEQDGPTQASIAQQDTVDSPQPSAAASSSGSKSRGRPRGSSGRSPKRGNGKA
ncbi:hypothetical protein GCM10022255_064970 [Dactylosporangium darangshiense]|uniref:Uncharacterized protein n=1 Tax=Dactylosporangium darangshiense TaxID=579108 RepID=A0ABP8DGS1_9ACTN